MAKSQRVVVQPNTPTALANVADANDRVMGNTFMLDNDNDTVVGLGGSDVDATTSARVLKARSTLWMDLGDAEELWAVHTGAGPVTIDVLKVR